MSTPATNQQVQQFVDQRLRPRCAQIRSLLLSMQDDISEIGDVYAACTQQSPTWTDSNPNGPPHLLTTNDILAINTLMANLVTAISTNGQWPVGQLACLNGVLS